MSVPQVLVITSLNLLLLQSGHGRRIDSQLLWSQLNICPSLLIGINCYGFLESPLSGRDNHPWIISGVIRKMPVAQDARSNVIHLKYPRQELVPGIEIFHDQQ